MQSPGTHPSAHHRLRCSGRTVLLLGALLLGQPAGAVFTYLPFTSPRFIQLQVGSTGVTVNTVNFTVNGASTSPSPVQVTGVPDSTTPATSPSGGVLVRMRGQWNSGTETLRLSVNSAVGLACLPGTGCGSTVIPFTHISWISHGTDASHPGFDIQSGAFNGSATQNLASFTCCGTGTNLSSGSGTVQMSNTLVFRYSNDTLYPAGTYRGTVTFTATLL